LGFSCFGFLASRFPRFWPLVIDCSLVRLRLERGSRAEPGLLAIRCEDDRILQTLADELAKEDRALPALSPGQLQALTEARPAWRETRLGRVQPRLGGVRR
jgi:hypothetical protein